MNIKQRIKRALVAKGGYSSSRMGEMNTEIIFWKARKEASTTSAEREFCEKMCDMYCKRYLWYVAK